MTPESVRIGIANLRIYLSTLPDRRLAVRSGVRFQVDGALFWIQRVGDKMFGDHTPGYCVWAHPARAFGTRRWVPGDTSSFDDVRPEIPALHETLGLFIVEEVLNS